MPHVACRDEKEIGVVIIDGPRRVVTLPIIDHYRTECSILSILPLHVYIREHVRALLTESFSCTWYYM